MIIKCGECEECKAGILCRENVCCEECGLVEEECECELEFNKGI